MAMLCLALVVAAAWVLFGAAQQFQNPQLAQQRGLIYAVVGPVLMAAYLLAVFLPPRRWVWGYNVTLLGLSLLVCFLWPVSIPLLIMWMGEKTRTWYGWGGPSVLPKGAADKAFTHG
jgi:hypothetical protein